MSESMDRVDYIALQGLTYLRNRHIDAMNEIQEAVAHIVGQERDQYGYYDGVSDWLWDQTATADNLVEMYELTKPA